MAVVDRIRGRTSRSTPSLPPKTVQDRIQRGRRARDKGRPKRRLCWKFWSNEHYWYVNEKGILSFQDTVTHASGAGKPRHRIRNNYNFIRLVVEGKVSAATQKVPGYEIVPSTNDPEDLGAARLSEQIAWYGYDKWRIRRATTKAVTYALVCDEGFAMPYFDTSVGPFITTYTCPDCQQERQPLGECPCGSVADPVEETIGQGEIKVLVLSADQVYWEPGVDFEDSRWHVIERAVPIDEVKDYPGYNGSPLSPDATTSDLPDSTESDQMVMVSEYLERPSKGKPEGSRLRIANDRIICEPEDFPCTDGKGQVLDEPALHRISWTVDPESDHDAGLVYELIDLQRTINDCWNKLLEFKNRGLVPQIMAPRGSQMTPRTDEPGAVNYYNPVSGLKPDWEQPVRVPQELFQMLETSISHLRALASDTDVQAEADVAARTVTAVIEQAQQRWQSFLGDLAEFHSRLMRHCLYLVQKHYTEPRLVQIRGRYGWEPVQDFLGAQIRGQADVRVLPGSILTKSRQAVQDELQFIVSNFPGAISVEAALGALNGGNAEKLIESYQLHVRRATEMVRTFRQGIEAVERFGERVDPELGPVPGWMPRKQDNIAVHKHVFTDFMLTESHDQLPVETQELFSLYYDGLEWLEQQKAMKEAQMQQQMAEGLGMANAAAPQAPPPTPDRPGFGVSSASGSSEKMGA